MAFDIFYINVTVERKLPQPIDGIQTMRGCVKKEVKLTFVAF